MREALMTLGLIFMAWFGMTVSNEFRRKIKADEVVAESLRQLAARYASTEANTTCTE